MVIFLFFSISVGTIDRFDILGDHPVDDSDQIIFGDSLIRKSYFVRGRAIV